MPRKIPAQNAQNFRIQDKFRSFTTDWCQMRWQSMITIIYRRHYKLEFTLRLKYLVRITGIISPDPANCEKTITKHIIKRPETIIKTLVFIYELFKVICGRFTITYILYLKLASCRFLCQNCGSTKRCFCNSNLQDLSKKIHPIELYRSEYSIQTFQDVAQQY